MLPNKESESAIKQQEGQAINAIKEEADKVVLDATTRIEAEITNAIGKADDTLKTAIELAQSTIKENVNAEIKKQSVEIKKEIESDIKKSKRVGLVGLVFGLIGFACAVLALLKLKTMNLYGTKSISTEVFLKKFESQRVKKALETICNSTLARQISNVYATKKEINELKTKIEAKSERYDATYRQSVSVLKRVQSDDRNGMQNAYEHILTAQQATYELYANETNSMAISEVYEKYQPGYSIYRLVLQHQDSTTAEIELCTNHDDAKRRITKNDDTLLSSICDIKRISEDPKDVVILAKGIVEKVSKSEWRVVKKIMVELR